MNCWRDYIAFWLSRPRKLPDEDRIKEVKSLGSPGLLYLALEQINHLINVFISHPIPRKISSENAFRERGFSR